MPRTNQVLNSLLEEAVLISEELYDCLCLLGMIYSHIMLEQVALSYEDGCPVEDSRLEEEVAKKKEEFHNDATIRKISEQCEADKIQFQVEVLQGNVPDVAINASIRLEATSVILDKSVPLSNL
ncbi:hypothetical protein RJT34_03753 [Clitoria ternatea]|uniref:Uncharacterized protein n=1 Tax=Clitoria ternatea TaxID=43366 RepID=A0AAN9KNK5_CLITE